VQKVREAELEEKIQADSAGTGHWHVGEPPHVGTRRILEQYAIAYDHHLRAAVDAGGIWTPSTISQRWTTITTRMSSLSAQDARLWRGSSTMRRKPASRSS